MGSRVQEKAIDLDQLEFHRSNTKVLFVGDPAIAIHNIARLWTDSDTSDSAEQKKSYYKRITTLDDFYIPTTFYTCTESPEVLQTLNLTTIFKRLHGLCWMYDAGASVESVQSSFDFWSSKISDYLRNRDLSSLPIFVIGVSRGKVNQEAVLLGQDIAASLYAVHNVMTPQVPKELLPTLVQLFTLCFRVAMRRLSENFDLLVDENNMKAAL